MMIKKLDLQPQVWMGGIPSSPTDELEMFHKINELIDVVNELGRTVDEFTGCAPRFRPTSEKRLDKSATE